MPLNISGVSDLMSAVLQRRHRSDPHLPRNCGLPSKTSFSRGLQTVIATLPFSKWPHAHGILSSELTTHAWYTICCTVLWQSCRSRHWNTWLFCKKALLLHLLPEVSLLFQSWRYNTYHCPAHRSWLTVRETKKEYKGTHQPKASGTSQFPKPELGAMMTPLGPTVSYGVPYARFWQCFLCPPPLVNGLC